MKTIAWCLTESRKDPIAEETTHFRGIYLYLSSKLPHCGLAPIILEGIVEALNGENQSVVLSSNNATIPQQ